MKKGQRPSRHTRRVGKKKKLKTINKEVSAKDLNTLRKAKKIVKQATGHELIIDDKQSFGSFNVGKPNPREFEDLTLNQLKKLNKRDNIKLPETIKPKVSRLELRDGTFIEIKNFKKR